MGTRKYDLNLASSSPDAIRMLYITSSICENDWISSLHSHSFTELFYIKEGHGSFILGDQEYKVKKNDLIMINPLVQHTEYSEKSNPLDYYVIGIENLKMIETDNYSVLSAGTEIMRNCFHNIHQEMIGKKEGFDDICQHYFQIILLLLQRKSKISFSIDEPDKGSRECQLVKNYIDANFAYSINLDTLADKYGLNKYYLCHRFNEIYGTSPIMYLNQVRIDNCKDLLRTTNHSMNTISEMVGYSSPSYLSQAFKKNVGETPQMYRKKHMASRT